LVRKRKLAERERGERLRIRGRLIEKWEKFDANQGSEIKFGKFFGAVEQRKK